MAEIDGLHDGVTEGDTPLSSGEADGLTDSYEADDKLADGDVVGEADGDPL